LQHRSLPKGGEYIDKQSKVERACGSGGPWFNQYSALGCITELQFAVARKQFGENLEQLGSD
jgi:hypothetical protein